MRLSDGTRLHVASHGDASAPVAVVLVHGWTLDSRSWRHQIAGLNRQGIAEVFTYDARGHGRSGQLLRRQATIGQLADDLDEVLTAVARHRPVVLVGHSLGGITIIEHAARHRQSFEALVGAVVLVSTTAEGTTHTTYGLPAPLASLLRNAELIGARVLAQAGPYRPHRPLATALRPGLRWLLFGSPAAPDAVALTSAMVASAPLRSIGSFRPAVGAHDGMAALDAMATVPVTVLVGERDRLTPPTCSLSIAGALPHAACRQLPDAGHMLPLERPAEVTSAIAEAVAAALAAVASAAERDAEQPGEAAA